MITPYFVTFFLASCSTPVKKAHWEACEEICRDHEGVLEACDEIVQGLGCHCNNGTVAWFSLEVTDDNPKHNEEPHNTDKREY